MKLGIFIRGLVPFELKGYVKEVSPGTLLEAYKRTKLYENIWSNLELYAKVP